MDCSKEFCEDIVNDVKKCFFQPKDDIKQKKKEAIKLKPVLCNKGEVSLAIVELEIEQKLKSLQHQLTEKLKEISEILNEQKALCEVVVEPQLSQSEDPLPTTKVIRSYLNNLHNSKGKCLNRVENMREDIKKFVHMLKQEVNTVTEDRLLNYSNIKLGKGTLAGLQDMYDRMISFLFGVYFMTDMATCR